MLSLAAKNARAIFSHTGIFPNTRCCAQEVRKVMAILASSTIPNPRFHRDSWLARCLVGFYPSSLTCLLFCKVFRGGAASCPVAEDNGWLHRGGGRPRRGTEGRGSCQETQLNGKGCPSKRHWRLQKGEEPLATRYGWRGQPAPTPSDLKSWVSQLLTQVLEGAVTPGNPSLLEVQSSIYSRALEQ